MTSPLYTSRGIWSATTPYTYLDVVAYSKASYICTDASGSLNQRPDLNAGVWVMMPVITQEDQYYLRSRENLLQYEDARYQSLINAMANFYTTRNDQSVWGAFLRAISIELARIEYMYSYDVVAKNPQYLTPPDIKREYADPLFVTGNFQQLSQFDSGSFGGSFGVWGASSGVILRTAILVLDGGGTSYIQVATTAGETGDVEPPWVFSTGATTTDGSVVWTSGGIAPTTLAYPIGYRDMLVDLLAAYQEGATVKSIEDVIYAYTGKSIIVEELYKEISGGVYDQSDRNAIKVSVNVGGADPLTDIQSLEELQQITNSLYGAIGLAKPAHVGLNFTTVFGAGENIDCFITPQFLTQAQLSLLSMSQQNYYTLIAYVSAQPVWTAGTAYTLNQIVWDSNGYLQQVNTAGVTGKTQPDWATVLEDFTLDNQVVWQNIGTPQIAWIASTHYVVGTLIQANGNIQLVTVEGDSGGTIPTWGVGVGTSTTDGQVTWVNIGTPQISTSAYASLSSAYKPYYQGYYQDLNCVGTGINDTLRITIQLYEEPPFDPMLYQAPIVNLSQAPQSVVTGQKYVKGAEYTSTNPTTTLAAYGCHLFSPLSQANWIALQAIPQVWSNAATYSKGALVAAVSATTPGSFNSGVWTPGGWQLYRAAKKNGVGTSAGAQNPLSSPTYWVPLSGISGQMAPSVWQAYYRTGTGQYTTGNLQQWAPGTAFYTGQYGIDNNGNLQLAYVGGTASPLVNVLNSSVNPAVSIYGDVLTIRLVPGQLTNMGLVVGVSSVTLLNFAYSTFLNNLTLPVTAIDTVANTITLAYTHVDYNSSTNSEGSAYIRVAFSATATVPTYDGTILWQYLGLNYLNTPSKWIQVVDSTGNPTGETANWDANHQMGLMAPRQDLCWEISGGDFFSGLEME